MQGHWENGRFVLASTQQDKITMYRTYLVKILDTAAANGEDCSYAIAKEALNRKSPYPEAER